MDFSLTLPTFIITLREGVEAALVIGIVMAYLQRAQRAYLNRWVFAGIGAGLAISGMVGALFNWFMQSVGQGNPELSPILEPLLEGVFSLAAIVMLTWMLIWMTKQSRALKGEIEGSLANVLGQGNKAGLGIFTLILFAILREGFEVILFISAKFQEGLMPALGAVGGIMTAALLAVALFKFGLKINIRVFFQVMGFMLLAIVSGLVIAVLSHFDTALRILSQTDRKSADICFYYEHFVREHSCILGPMVWNTSKILPAEKFPGVILSSLFGYTDKLYLVQGIAYLVFFSIVGMIYYRSLRGGAGKSKANPAGVN
ncbi:MAG: FTR1 family protein [Pseudanabaenaceae cyanobacterium]|jgi:high-affinity iron transporter